MACVGFEERLTSPNVRSKIVVRYYLFNQRSSHKFVIMASDRLVANGYASML